MEKGYRNKYAILHSYSDTLLKCIIQGITFFNPLKFFIILSFFMIFFICIPAMVIAMFEMHTLSLYYMIFGTTLIILFALGIIGDIIRVSSQKNKK